jgi:hypothetical protein
LDVVDDQDAALYRAEKARDDDTYLIQSVMKAMQAVAANNITNAEPNSLLDCIDATCRVTTTAERASRGTGVAFEISNDVVYVITNAHVATTKKMKLEFWKDGHRQDAIYGLTIVRDVKRDVAIIGVKVSAFGGDLPTVIPLSSRDTILKVDQEVLSVGCPRGEWAKAWSGHVLQYDGNGRVEFMPPPVGGQSGSAIFSADGREIVALLNLQALSPSGRPIYGMAVNVQEIYNAIYGVEALEVDPLEPLGEGPVNYWKRQRGWPYSKQPSQCGPRGCPSDKPKDTPAPDPDPEPEPEPSIVVPFVLPVLPEIIPEAIVGPDPVPPLPAEVPNDVQIEITPEDPPADAELEVVWVENVWAPGFFIMQLMYGFCIGILLILVVCVLVELARKLWK